MSISREPNMIRKKVSQLLKNALKISGGAVRVAIGIGSAALLLFSLIKKKTK
ncbi:MAG: hypothetical protein RDU01_06015 [Thermodesulfovibrionales bacterium]|nr:hypothetical protein [Thermodesulfovibrionales bacterium]